MPQKEMKEKIDQILNDNWSNKTERLLELSEAEKQKLAEEIKLKPAKRNCPSESFVDDYYMGYNQAIEDYEVLKKKILKGRQK